MNSKSDADSTDSNSKSASESDLPRSAAEVSPESTSSVTKEKVVTEMPEDPNFSLKVPFTFFKVTFFKEEVNEKAILMVNFEKRYLMFYVKKKEFKRINFAAIAKVEITSSNMITVYRAKDEIQLELFEEDTYLLFHILYCVSVQRLDKIPFKEISKRMNVCWCDNSLRTQGRLFSTKRYALCCRGGIFIYADGCAPHAPDAVPDAVPRIIVAPKTKFTERKRDGVIVFKSNDEKSVKVKVNKKSKYDKLMECYVNIESESVKCFHEQHSFGTGRLRTLLPFARDMVNDAMLSADECEEHFKLLCKLIRAISKKPYATYPAKERIQRHNDERVERELLIRAYKAKKRGKPLNSEEENELEGIYVSDLTTTPSSYSSSPTTETDTTETELSPENEQQKLEQEKEYIKGVKVKEKQMKKMMKLYTAAVKKEDPERFYIPEAMVGKGGYGEVYRAVKNGTNEVVAYKTIKQTTKDRIPKIAAEVGLLIKLKHELIVNFIEAFQYRSRIVLVMEFLDGGSIKNHISENQVPFKEADIAYVMYNVLQGLKFIHEKGFIHRDIKTANIMLTSAGKVKLIDLGLVVPQIPKPESRAGSKPYMAPEVILMKPYGTPCDIWSVGCVAQEMAELLPPYREFCLLRLMFRTALVGAQGIRKPERHSAAFCDFVEQCFAYLPEKRATADELLKHQFLLKQKDSFIKRHGAMWSPEEDSVDSN